jgi:hypothetical protein
MRAAGDGWVEGGYSAIEWFLERVLGWRLQWRPMLAAGGFMGRPWDDSLVALRRQSR